MKMASVELATVPSSNEEDTGRLGSAETWNSWDTYNFEWLFDPNRFDHLPIEEQLLLYKHRDLKQTKIYKIAARIWGAPLSRKRKIVAPPMHTAWDQDSSSPLKSPPISAQLKPQTRETAKPVAVDSACSKPDEKNDVKSYNKWMKDRKKFRADLDNMGLNEEWLSRKPDKTALEHRVLRRMIEERNPQAIPPPIPTETPLDGILPDQYPTVKRPSPLAIRIIEKFLHENKMRLVDLFRRVDKDKDWKLSREEFRSAVTDAKIPMSNVLLEDLILALDTDLNNELDYRELAKGMGLWKIEKRETKKKTVQSESSSPRKFALLHGFEPPELEKEKLLSGSLLHNGAKSKSTDAGLVSPGASSPAKNSSPSRIKSALSTISSASSQYLEPPDMDMRSEQYILDNEEAMVDLRKRDKAALPRLLADKKKAKTQGNSGKANSLGSKRKSPSGSLSKSHASSSAASDTKTMIKTGNKPVDSHCTPSTMTDGTGQLVDKFRQLKFKEYNEICQLCQENSVPFTEKLLNKVLLFPPDKSHKELKRQIRQPAMHLISSSSFSDPPKRSATPDAVEAPRKSGQMILSKSGKILVDARHSYPMKSNLDNKPQKVTLSTGKAVIRTQVNCWMTFEEYDGLTKHLVNKYRTLHGRTDNNAFWPGHLLDKMRLCMPTSPPKKTSVFQTVKRTPPSNPGYNNNLNSWPISDAGYVQYGSIDK